jgi:hypothetical protein
MAAQDQTLNKKYYATKLLHTETDSKCRLCQQSDETIDHIISAHLAFRNNVLAKSNEGIARESKLSH